MIRGNMPIAAGLLAGAVLGMAVGAGCSYCTFGPDDESVPVDLGIDADLDAVVDLDHWDGDRNLEFLAVGANGTVVAWGNDHGPKDPEPIVEVFDIGDRDLHDVWLDKRGDTVGWWVVGDGALIMVSNNRGATWESVELQSDADLHGIAAFDGRPIVVGDELVAMRTIDGTWTELTPPAGGWGQLRGIYVDADEPRIEVVGLGGVIWSASDPSGEWTLEPSGVTTDLFDVFNGYVVGAEGTLLRHNESGWVRHNTGVEVDLVDIDYGRVLGANGDIYDTLEPLGLIKTTEPGARGLSKGWFGSATVGEGGSAFSPPPWDC